MTGLDAFYANPQPEPPDSKLAQVEQGVGRSEGNAVIAANVIGKATLLEKPFKHGKSIVFAGRGKSFATQQIRYDLLPMCQVAQRRPGRPTGISSSSLRPIIAAVVATVLTGRAMPKAIERSRTLTRSDGEFFA